MEGGVPVRILIDTGATTDVISSTTDSSPRADREPLLRNIIRNIRRQWRRQGEKQRR